MLDRGVASARPRVTSASPFGRALRSAGGVGPLGPGRALATGPDDAARTWQLVAYDQLHEALGPLATLPPTRRGIVLVECPAKARRRPYHQQKLALLLSSLRHFAVEQARRGVAVRYLVDDSYAAAAARAAATLGPLALMRPAERELRAELAPLLAAGTLREAPHDGWLTTADEFLAWAGPRAPWRMDAFYRGARRARDVLMDARGAPLGGTYSHDADNRKRWPGSPPAPAPPRFAVDDITAEVGELVGRAFADHPGRLDLGAIPASVDDAAALWRWARRECLPTFGPYEDAMSTASSTLFHTQLSPLLNLHRLLPRQVLADALRDDDEAGAPEVPLASREGFVRQVLGWREFVHHVHEQTDGFRALPGMAATVSTSAGDGGHARWRGGVPTPSPPTTLALGGVSPPGGQPLPPAYWGTPSGLRCLDHVVAEVWRTGYSHHITRLMVLANLGMLLDVSPRELTDWFWVAYVDAYDWVVEPNVLGMGMFALGDVMTTKPYVAGAAYIHKMSDYCKGCAWNPKTTCPLTRMYWAYLGRHERALAGNPRMMVPLGALRRRAPAERAEDERTFRAVSAALAAGARYGTNAPPAQT